MIQSISFTFPIKLLCYCVSFLLNSIINGQSNPLSEAIYSGDYDKAISLVSQNTSINQISGKLAWTPIFYSIFQVGISPNQYAGLQKKNKKLKDISLNTHKINFQNLCESLIKKGANINLYDKRGRSPLYYSVVFRLDFLVTLFLAKNVRIEDSEDLFKLASAHGYSEIVNYMIKVKLNPCEAEADCFAPIHLACINGHLSCIESILKIKKHVNCPTKENFADFSGLSPLQLAAMHGNYSLINLLVQSGADINQLNNKYENLLHLASKGGRNEVFKLDKKGEPIEYLFVKGGNSDCIKKIDSISKKLHTTDQIGANPLHWAAYYRKIDEVVLLLKMGELPVKLQLGAEHSFASMLSQLILLGVSGQPIAVEQKSKLLDQVKITEKMFADSIHKISNKIVGKKIIHAGFIALAAAAASYQASIDAQSTGFGYSKVEYPVLETGDLASINKHLKNQVAICQKLIPLIETLNPNITSDTDFIEKLKMQLNTN